MLVPTVGSQVKIVIKNDQGPRMIPPQPSLLEYEGKVLPPYKWLTDRQFCLSGSADWPIRVIYMDYVDTIEVITGSTIKVSTDTKTWEIKGSKDNKYIVTRTSQKWSCTCPGFQFRKQCKHISELSGVS